MIMADFLLDPKTLAALLLALRVLAVGLIGMVLVRQIRNIHALHTDYPAVRMTILLLTLVLFVGQIIPILLDGSVVFTDFTSARNVSTLLAAYTVNNALKDVAMGLLLAFLYFRPHATKPPEKPVIDK